MASQDRSAMMASLHTHFLGPAQVERIVQYACTKCDRATYRSQAIYSFVHFSTDLQEAFTLLGLYDAEIPQAEQIRLLCEKIHTKKAYFNAAAVTMLMDGTHATFAEAIAHVLQFVSHFFPATTTLSRGCGQANISSLNLSQVAHKQCGNKYFYNGIDITDFTCRYNHDEWMKLKVLGYDKNVDIRKQKTIGTRNHNSEGTENTQHAKDSDGSSFHPTAKNTQGTSVSTHGRGGSRVSQPGKQCEGTGQHDDVAHLVEP